MNQLLKMWRRYGAAALLLIAGLWAKAQNSSTCNLTIDGADYPVTALVPATSKTGLDFNLSVSLPGLGSDYNNCTYTINANTSSNLIPPTYQNSYVCSSGHNIDIPFKFRPGVTCNGEVGTLNIHVTMTCDAQEVASCDLSVSLIAEAKNYWTVTKDHVWGNLIGGQIQWNIRLINTNPNPGIGDYNIAAGSKIIDQISNGSQITSVSVPYTLNTNGDVATWLTGNISSTTIEVDYLVTTVCNDPAATLVQNCADYILILGPPDCHTEVGNVCDDVLVIPVETIAANIEKWLYYPQDPTSSINYTTGCEGEYVICFNNTGNTPLTDITLTDVFPPGIKIKKITLKFYDGVNLLPATADFPGGTPGGANIVSVPYTITFTTGPASMNIQFTGSMTYGRVCLHIRFEITASPGTYINNCAELFFNNGQHDNDCADFTVETEKEKPGISKCISIGQQSFEVGDIIPFCITISNHGAAPINDYLVSDWLALPGSPQNLQIIPSSVQYSYGSSNYYGYTPCCPFSWTGMSPLSNTLPTWGSPTPLPDFSNPQNPIWPISNMPGDCRYGSAYYLVIKFDAQVMPQSHGQYSNNAVIAGHHTFQASSALYNILHRAKIGTTKLVNSHSGGPFGTIGYVNPGGLFQYKFRVKNEGTVPLNHIYVEDEFPNCVQYTCAPGVFQGMIYDQSGNPIDPVPVTCSTPIPGTTRFDVPTSVQLNPGDYLEFIIDVQRISNGAPCCNEATGHATAVDNGQNIQDEDGPVCVLSGGKCEVCDIHELGVETFSLQPMTTGSYWNFGVNISAGRLPVQEVEISLTDFHYTYSYPDCKPQRLSNFTGHLTTTTPIIGNGLSLSPSVTPAVNNSLRWVAGTPLVFAEGRTFNLHIWRPNMLAIPSCTGELYYCLKVRLKDVTGHICEKIICNEVPLSGMKEIQESPDMMRIEFSSPEGN